MCVVILNQFLIGVGWGWIAPTLVKLNSPDSVLGHLTVDQISWLASINEVGRLLGPVVSPALVDNIGRKYTLVVISVMYFMVWLSIIFARNIYLLYAARVVFGLANGVNDVVTGIYTTENCSPNFRGIIGSVTVLMNYIAIFLELVIVAYTSYTGTAIVNLVMVVCVFATLYFGTETPYFFIMKGKREEAEKNLIWLSGNLAPIEVADELRQIEESVSEEKLKTKSLKLLFLSSVNLRGILVVVGIHVFQMMTGVAAILTYAPLIFSSSEALTTNQFTILFGVMQLVAVAISPFVIEKMSRRSLMIGTFAGIAASSVCSSALIYTRGKGYQISFYPWLIFASVSLCGMLVALGSPVINAVKGELLPLSVRAIGSSIAVTTHSLTSFCVTKVFLPITESYGMATNFIIYFTVSSLAVLIICYVLPETRGKTCLLYTSPSPRDRTRSRMPSSA